MTDLVILVLVFLWIAVLTPRLVRRFREGYSHSSIDSFHEQLHLLERAGPKLVEPAYRLEVPGPDPAIPGLVLVGAGGTVGAGGAVGTVDDGGARHATPPLVRRIRQKQSTWERRRSRRRRRDLLLALIAVAVLTGGLGAMHALHLLWAITGVSALAIAGYVALVAYAQILYAERDAARPVPSAPPDLSTAASLTGRPRHASIETPASVEILGAGSRRAARAGYPGAWDDAELVSIVPRHVAGGA